MKEETTITFLASECGEFHEMGECIECTSLKEAFRHYQRFCKRSPQMVPSLEFSLHHADDPLYNEGEYPLATREKGKELLSYVPYYANHPLVQEAVRELEKLEEVKALIEHLEIPVYFATLGASNAVWVEGRLPEDRQSMVSELEKVCSPENEMALRHYRTNLRHL